jgi:hypothetical protein
METGNSPEFARLGEDARREKFWKLWGPYLSLRQWGTVREDYSDDGDVWRAFSYEDAMARAYRWGEDGLLGWTDHWCRLCFSPVLWNGRDPFLKERLFGLAGPEGNHGEDVKEVYYHLEATPTHSFQKAVYYYPQRAFPYEELRRENAGRSREMREYELADTGVWVGNRFFVMEITYAKANWDDTLIEVRLRNAGEERAMLHFLPTLWFRNTWSWGEVQETPEGKPRLWAAGKHKVNTKHPSLPAMDWLLEEPGTWLFTENETNQEKLYGVPNRQPFVKDAFHRWLVEGEKGAINPHRTGTKCAVHYRCDLAGGEEKIFRFRLRTSGSAEGGFGHAFPKVLEARRTEAETFFAAAVDPALSPEKQLIVRRAQDGLLWSKQFYSLVQMEWAQGDPGQPAPPPGHAASRNRDWQNLFSQDVILMPDTWEYPYFCAWDLAFHAVSVSRRDPFLAKEQLDLLTREWYMHPNGQFPAYEWNFGDVNPPVHSWAVWRLHRLPLWIGAHDRAFLEAQFQKLLLNFTWWVNRKDPEDNDLFAGGFLGLDNIGVFDRSKPLPTGGTLKQADGTGWMAFYCMQMLQMALELAQEDAVYETMASKFFQHFIRIAHAMNSAGGCGLWDDEDGFYYDLLEVEGEHQPLRVRSLVGLVPLLAAGIVPGTYLRKLPEFGRRVIWFMHHRPELTQHLRDLNPDGVGPKDQNIIALVPPDRLPLILRRLFDEEEFLSPFGFRSLSKVHEKSPYTYWSHGVPYSVDYEPGEGKTGMFGGNSNWRGPIWLPMNYLLIEALRTYHRYYGEGLQVEFPTGSGQWMNLGQATRRVAERLSSLFLPDAEGRRPSQQGAGENPAPADGLWFFEYYDAETGRGCGASHQTGWSSLIADLLNLESHWNF